jgi:LysM repeat protein
MRASRGCSSPTGRPDPERRSPSATNCPESNEKPGLECGWNVAGFRLAISVCTGKTALPLAALSPLRDDDPNFDHRRVDHEQRHALETDAGGAGELAHDEAGPVRERGHACIPLEAGRVSRIDGDGAGRRPSMGLWDFVKDAGKKLGIGSADAAEAPKPEALEAEVKDLGLKAEGLQIAVEGDRVKVRGKAASQAEKEKVILAVGNVAGVAAVDEEIETPEAAAKEPVFHTVKKGDTLWAIAKAELGDGNRYPEIFEANKPMLSHPDKIYPGQVLRIPG